MAALEPRRGPERALDLMLRVGPYGDRFGAEPDGLTLEQLEAAPHGIDLGPLEPRIPEVLRTAERQDRARARADRRRRRAARGSLARPRNGGMVLVGRRQLRSNNSWMHNVPNLVRGKERCTAARASRRRRAARARGRRPRAVSSSAGSIEIPVEVTDGVMPGVVSIPHGWGHDEPGDAAGRRGRARRREQQRRSPTRT